MGANVDHELADEPATPQGPPAALPLVPGQRVALAWFGADVRPALPGERLGALLELRFRPAAEADRPVAEPSGRAPFLRWRGAYGSRTPSRPLTVDGLGDQVQNCPYFNAYAG